MKIAHFGNFAPNRAGIHSAARDLILAERSVGIESNYIDYGSEKNATFSRVWLKDGDVETVSPEWAINEADIIVRHSAIPERVMKTEKPIVFYLHGRPEYSFLLDWEKKVGCTREEMHCAKLPQYKKFICFWKEHIDFWKHMLGGIDVAVGPPPMDFKDFTIEGTTYKFKSGNDGSPNILICDMWREDITPFNVIFAAIKFAEMYCPTAKIHVIALPSPGEKNPVIDPLFGNLRKSGYLGKLSGIVRNLNEIMRAADFLITPLNITTRIVMEAQGCGLPIVGGTGSSFTPYTADPRCVDRMVTAIRKCWEDIKDDKEIKKHVREKAIKTFSLKKTGNAVKKIYEGITDGKL